MSGSDPTIHEWQTGAVGDILDPTKYVVDAPFEPGDTLVVSSGGPSVGSFDPGNNQVALLPDGTYEFDAGQTDAPTLSTDDVGFSAASVFSVTGPGTVAWTQYDNSENDGDVAVGGNGSAGNLAVTVTGLNTGTTSPTFTNTGLFTVDDASSYSFGGSGIGHTVTFDNAADGTIIVTGGSLFQVNTSPLEGTSANPSFVNDGLIVVGGSGSVARLQANVSGAGTILIEGVLGAPSGQTGVGIAGNAINNFIIASGELQVSNESGGGSAPILGGTVTFNDNDGQLRLDGGVNTSAVTIDGFQAGDQIDVTGFTSAAAGIPGNAVYVTPSFDSTTDTLTVTNNDGMVYAALHIAGKYTTSDFQLTPYFDASDPSGAFGYYVRITTDVTAPCFVAGTLIETDRGGLPVELLRAGDVVVLADGGTAPVVWIGRRRIDCLAHPDPEGVLPVRVRRGAMGGGLPTRDLMVSPDHALFVDGVLVPAGLLVDGNGIVQEACGLVSYFHVELDRHAVLLAEGLPAESYLDTGNRAEFANAPLAAPTDELGVRDGVACAEMVLDGERLEMIRRKIARLRPSRLAA